MLPDISLILQCPDQSATWHLLGGAMFSVLIPGIFCQLLADAMSWPTHNLASCANPFVVSRPDQSAFWHFLGGVMFWPICHMTSLGWCQVLTNLTPCIFCQLLDGVMSWPIFLLTYPQLPVTHQEKPKALQWHARATVAHGVTQAVSKTAALAHGATLEINHHNHILSPSTTAAGAQPVTLDSVKLHCNPSQHIMSH